MPLVARLASVVRIPRRLRAFDPLLRDFGAQNFNGAKPDLIAPRVGARKPPFSSVVCAEAERIHVHSTPDGSSSPGQGSKGEVKRSRWEYAGSAWCALLHRICMHK
uniref:Uncharacterized protein n=1 Tax=Oryza punctata TaxID=4537 RepID=A0A0E0KWG8_ORYPU